MSGSHDMRDPAAAPSPPHLPLLRRVAERTGRATVPFTLDGEAADALEGDTVLTAVLTRHGRLRRNEFSGAPRAGFCLMGACQDCWIATGEGERLRACSTFIAPGMVLLTGGDAA
jgi:predicted molibdopterin-dependent oxidoreductase YjgC